MGLLTISSGTGETIFNFPLSGLRSKDDTFDNKSGGAYAHRADEFSASEANEWQSLFFYLVEQLKRGGTCIDAYAAVPLVPGPCAVAGYKSGKFVMGYSDSGNNVQADAFVQVAVASGNSFFAQLGCIISGTALDTRVPAVGSPVYVGVSGEMTLSGTAGGWQQRIGYTLGQFNSGYSAIAAMPLQAKVAGLTSGSVTSGFIGDAAVFNTNIANGAVTNTNIANGAVANWNIVSGTVASWNIASGTVESWNIANGAVTSGKIANGAVMSGKIDNEAVASWNIANGAVTSGKIDNEAVASWNIANGAVTSGKIASGAVGWWAIPDAGYVGSGFLAKCYVTGTLLVCQTSGGGWHYTALT